MPPRAKPLELSEPDTQPANPLEALLGYQLRRASQAMMGDLSTALASLDLRIAEMSILLVIEENPDITQSEIGRVLAIQRANMVPLTTQLERRGLLRRGATVGRAQSLRLSAAGRALARECRKRIATHEAKFLDGIPETQRATLLRLLRLVWDR